ncbi:hypothetical protein [Luedemannella helvata]|uniref:Uncharacterized protein n=1 Tax=Luedemannella helvata TaxID=349315 RepID=A0ABP4WB63_9ACTN
MSVYYPPSNPTGPGRPPKPPITPGWVFAGIGLAMLGHLLTIVPAIPVLAASTPGGDAVGTAVIVMLIAQVVVFLGCLVAGIVLLAGERVSRGLGLGLLIGWAVGVLVVPVVGFGLCVQAISSY